MAVEVAGRAAENQTLMFTVALALVGNPVRRLLMPRPLVLQQA